MAVIVVKHEFEGDKNFAKLSLWVIPITLTYCAKRLNVNFLLDTGAQQTVIVSDVQKLLNLPNTNKFQQGIGISGKLNYSLGEIDNLEIGSISLGSVTVLIGTLPPIYEKYNISGLLGADLLKMLCLTIDYPQKLLAIEKTIVLP